MQISKSILLCSFLFCLSAFTAGDEKINWDAKRSLTWDDFQGNVENSSPYKAMTMSEISVDLTTAGDSVRFNVYNAFVKNVSWSKDKSSDYLLRHEQLHFNITEIFARKIRKAFAKSGPYQIKSLQKEVNEIRSKIYGESKEFQKKYDAETKHSEDKEMQKKWDKVITYELTFLEDYAASAVSAKLKK